MMDTSPLRRLCRLAVVIAVCLPWPASAAPDPATVEREVLAAFGSLVEASQDLDAARYFSHFDADKFVGLNADGTVWQSLDDLEPMINEGFAAIATVTALVFDKVKVSVIDAQTAVLVNEFVQTIEFKHGGTAKYAGGGAQVWSKRSGAWKLVSISASNSPIRAPQ